MSTVKASLATGAAFGLVAAYLVWVIGGRRK